MKPIQDNVVIQIEVTNACHLSCANCSRHVGHHKKPFYMTLDEVEKSIMSLKGYQGRVGLMGGEPALHPNFEEICELFIKHIPNRRNREFWTAGYKWDEYEPIRIKTFDDDLVHYNDHSKPDEGWHQPLLVSIDEVVEDKQVMWKLIDNCWIQRRWSASITPKGAYFCEVAASLHHTLGGPDGWPLEDDWWKKGPQDYKAQKEFACLRCSAALPMGEIPNNHIPQDMMSEGNLELLKANQSPKVKAQRVQIVKKEDAVRYLNSVKEVEVGERGYLKSHPEWRPSEFRTKVWHKPGEGSLDAVKVRDMQKKGIAIEGSTLAKGIENRVIAIGSKGPFTITSNVLGNFKKDVPRKTELLEPLLDIEFSSVNEMYRSIDDWSEGAITDREKDILLKHIEAEKF